MRVSIYMYVNVVIYIYIQICVYRHLHKHTYTYMRIHTYIYTSICVCVYIYIYVCLQKKLPGKNAFSGEVLESRLVQVRRIAAALQQNLDKRREKLCKETDGASFSTLQQTNNVGPEKVHQYRLLSLFQGPPCRPMFVPQRIPLRPVGDTRRW